MTRIGTLALFVMLAFIACSQKNMDHDSNDDSEVDDDSTYFELYGNYMPTKKNISVKDYFLESIQIDTHNSSSGRYIKSIYVQFASTKKTNEYYRVKSSFSGTKDHFSIFANDSILGKIEIEGMFFGVKGPMNDNIKDPKTIVFKGVLSVDGKTVAKFECTYFEGD